MTDNNRSNATTTTDTDLRSEGSTANQPLHFRGRSRSEATAFHRDLANGVRPMALGKPGASKPRAATTRRHRTSLGVLVPGLRLPKELSGYRPQDVGILTHAVIAIVAPRLTDLTAADLPEYLLDVTGALVNGKNINRRRVLQATATAHASRYLRRYAPSQPWEVLGAEFQTGQGRTDLAWRNSETGLVFFDEIKTHNRPIGVIAPDVVAQAMRQASGGRDEFGEQFAGVRVIPFGALHLLTLYRTHDGPVRLIPTTSQPLAEASPHDWATYSATCAR